MIENPQTTSLLKALRDANYDNIVSEQNILNIAASFNSELYHRGDVFSQQGTICNTIGIMHSGVMVSSYQNKNDEYRLTDLHLTSYNNMVCDFGSIATGKVSQGSIHSNRESVVHIIGLKVYTRWCHEIPFFNTLAMRFVYIAGTARTTLLKQYEGMSSDEMSANFIHDHPDKEMKLTRPERGNFFGCNPKGFTNNRGY